MDTIEVRRSTAAGASGPVFGEIYVNSFYVGVTLEPAWPTHISTGTYAAELFNSPKFGRTVIKLKDMNGRTDIEIHAGNDVGDTTGCILVGSSRSGGSIWHSNTTLDDLITRLHAPKVTVIVR